LQCRENIIKEFSLCVPFDSRSNDGRERFAFEERLMIQVEALSRAYGDFLAVDDISFQIDRGEVVGLLGHNGAGKTTIMKMLTGFLEPTTGRVTLDGLDIAQQRKQVQAKIGYLPENCPLYLEMTVLGYLEFAAALRAIPEAERPGRLRDVIESTGLTPKVWDPVQILSRGYRQRVGVAQALLSTPEVLILDEPTNGLDPSQIEQMRSLIRTIGKTSTVILSTHILQEVQAVCDRVLIIRNGKLALDARLDALQNSTQLHIAIDRPPDEATPALAALPGVSGVTFLERDDVANHYTLDFAPSDTPNRASKAAPQIAKALTGLGFEVYALHPERRDLERLFREINAASSEDLR